MENGKENQGIIKTDHQRIIEEGQIFAAELENIEKEDAEHKAQVRRVYSVKEASRRTTETIVEVNDVLGELRFQVLNSKEFGDLDLASCKTKEEMLQVVVYAMFHKVDPEITLADVKAMPADDYSIITDILVKYLPGFLSLGRQALKTTSTPNPDSKKSV